jgi:hypothetical protein
MPDNNYEIDFVIPWVDDTEQCWKKERSNYQFTKEEDGKAVRFRNWDNLKYWFRGVEKYAPWVRTIHLITCGHLPDWINENYPKLHIVKHEDYIPQRFLPTFNSHTIELNMHRIEGLSEHFVYFNDDIFLLKPLQKKDFFENGKPCDMLAFQPPVANPDNPVMSHVLLNNILVLSKYVNKRENVRQYPGNYFKIGYPPLYFFYNLLEMAFPLFTGLYTVHGPAPFCKQSFVTMWDMEYELLTATCSHRFRNQQDVNQYLMREWQKLTGEFHAKNITRDYAYFNIKDNNDRLLRMLKHQSKKIICINDTDGKFDFTQVKMEINGVLDQILPGKSAFEK